MCEELINMEKETIEIVRKIICDWDKDYDKIVTHEV